MPTKVAFEEALRRKFLVATQAGETTLVVNAGDLHRELGGYPGTNHQMPSCCEAMQSVKRFGDKVISSPAKGKGASFSMEYRLPRR